MPLAGMIFTFSPPTLLQQNIGVPFEPEALRNFDCRPQLVFAAGGLRIG